MRLALRPLRRLSLAALATLGACSMNWAATFAPSRPSTRTARPAR